MCLIGFALDAHDDFVLLLAANRDEYYSRAAAPASWWTDRAPAWGGRDLEAGGSWLAIDRHGRLAAVTNVRDPSAPPGRRSRGELVADFVGSDVPLDLYCAVGLTGAVSADCGPCTQLGVTMALREGVPGAAEALASGDDLEFQFVRHGINLS